MAGTPGRSGGDHTTHRKGLDHTDYDGGPIMPELPPEAAAKWQELVGQLPAYALRQADVHQLKILVNLLVHSDRVSQQMAANPKDAALGRLYVSIAAHIHRLSSCYGLTIKDRQGLRVEAPQPEDDPMERIAAMMGGRLR